MKIISKYKDYYDYLSGIWGIDEKVVLDRRTPYEEFLHCLDRDRYSLFYLCICDIAYNLLVGNGIIKIDKQLLDLEGFYFDEKNNRINYNHKLYDFRTPIELNKKTDINNQLNCPIVLSSYSSHWVSLNIVKSEKDWIKFPKLSGLKVASILPAEDIYKQLYSWLSKRNESNVVDSRNDVEKLTSAGFDKKTSFRNIK
jgi:hypothetical protein